MNSCGLRKKTMMNRIGILAVSVCFATASARASNLHTPQPNGTYDITAYGAIGDGKTLNTRRSPHVDAARKAAAGSWSSPPVSS